MLLSGIFAQFGVFGMLLLFTMLPVSSKYSTLVAVLATVSAVYSALLLLHQHDIKRIVACSSMTVMSIVLLGICSANGIGTSGVLFVAFSQGLSAALLFLVAGSIKHIFGERDIRLLRGAVIDAGPTVYAFLAGSLAMMGFPLTAGFVGYVLIFLGVVQTFGAYGAIALLALLLMSVYLYFTISSSMFSSKRHSASVGLTYNTPYIGYVTLLLFIFLFGILPYIFIGLLKT